MRRFLLSLVCLFGMSGCVYYGDIHGGSRPLSTAELNASHTYRVPSSFKAYSWWKKFRDPQLNQLMDVALQDSPTVLTAAARVREAKHLAEGAAAPLWPSLDFSGYVERAKFSYYGLVPPPFNGHTYNIGDLGFNLNYDIDFWGKNRETLAARVSAECAAQAELAEARLILSAAVANTYFQLLGNMEQLRLAKLYWRQSKELSDIVVDRAKNGIESDIPVKTALSNEQTARLSIDQFREAETLSRNQLAVLLGKNPFMTRIEARPLRFHVYHISLPVPLTANVLAQRPDIYAAKARAQAAAHVIKVAKAAFFPDISLNAVFSYQSVGLGHLFDVVSQNNSGTAAVDLPIFDAGARRANLGVKYAEYDVAVNQYNETILNALRDAADQLASLKSLRAQLASQGNAILATRHNYKLFLSRYNHGVVDYVPVLEISQLLTQQQATEANLQVRHLQKAVAMIKALGGQG